MFWIFFCKTSWGVGILINRHYLRKLIFGWQEASGVQRKAVFSLDSASSAVCLLIQLEKHVTEEGGVTPSVYTRKEPVSCSQFNQLCIDAYHAS
jgi:hypothetical protein